MTSPSNLLISKAKIERQKLERNVSIEHPGVDNNDSFSLFFSRQTTATQFHKLYSFYNIKELSWRLFSFSCRKAHLKKVALFKEHNTIVLFYGHAEQGKRTLLGGFSPFVSPRDVSCERKMKKLPNYLFRVIPQWRTSLLWTVNTAPVNTSVCPEARYTEKINSAN